jgi:hypothetical protein
MGRTGRLYVAIHGINWLIGADITVFTKNLLVNFNNYASLALFIIPDDGKPVVPLFKENSSIMVSGARVGRYQSYATTVHKNQSLSLDIGTCRYRQLARLHN